MLVCKEHEKWELNKALIHLWNSYLSLSVNSVQSSHQKLCKYHLSWYKLLYFEIMSLFSRPLSTSHLFNTWYFRNLGCSQREKDTDAEKDRLIAFWLREQGKGKPPVNEGHFGAQLGGMLMGPLLLLSYSVLATTLRSRIYHSLFPDEEAWRKLTN